MKRPFTLLSLGLFALGSFAQSGAHNGRVAEHMNTLRDAGVDFRETPLFTDRPRSATSDALWQDAVTQATVVRLDRSATAMLLGSRSEHISLTLPTEVGTMTLDLERVDITTADFQVTQASTGQAADVAEGLHYRGMIRGAEGSMAAISIFPDEVMGLMSDAQGERILGRFANDTEGDHVFYREQDLLASSGAVCGTADVDMSDDQGAHGSEITDRTVKCVRFYWEVNYDIFQGKGSVASAANYVTGLFNQSAILYANDGISVVLSEVYVWDVASPYTSTSTGTQLDTFGTTRTSFNGDLAHLLGYTGGGGVAFVNTICSSQTRYRMAYSDINSTFSNVPTYSWSVEVVTHEQGHNLGSSHTHACAWNGNNTAIDGCGPAAGYTEGSCAQGPLPSSSVGGTIMSYCHLTDSGIKFANGFGPQPSALIISRINAATCLTSCTVSCGNPSALTATGVTNTSANLSWAAVSGATSYTLQWKPNSGSTWTVITGITTNSRALTGLATATSYDYQVLAVCSGGSSVNSSIYTFVTTGGCVDTLEPNNTTAAPATITLPVTLNALVASATDADYYKFTLSGTSTVSITLANLAADYDLRLLNSAGTELASSTSGSTTNETISYASAPAGTYFIHVFGYNGVFSLTQCYALSASATGTVTCGVPSGLAAGTLTTTSALLSWGAVSGAVTYSLQWKTSAGSTWTTVTGLTGTSYSLGGLSAGTGYVFQVSTVCNGSSSAYATAVTFNTTAAACGTPSGLATGSITSASANLSWSAVPGAASYTLQWKTTAGTTWTTVSGLTSTSYALGGLSSSVAYQFQVRTNCASGSSAYSTPTSFTTSAATCSDVYEPNNARNNARTIPVNTALTGLLDRQYDQDWFKFANTAAASNIRVTLTNLPANYNISLYSGATMVGSSNASGTTNELIVFNTTIVASNYAVRVATVGTYSATLCYTLTVQIGSTSFLMEGSPDGSIEDAAAEVVDQLGYIFPNPANDVLNINMPASDLPTTLDMCDVSGRVVGTINHPAGTASGNVVLYVGEQPSGIYFIRITRGEERSVQRVVIGH